MSHIAIHLWQLITQIQFIMTQEQCERAVKALQDAGHYASHVMGAPDDHGVWIEVWNHDLQGCHEFRIHNEEIEYWESYTPIT